VLNKDQKSCWTPRGCVWREHSVWEPQLASAGNVSANILRQDYFVSDPITGERVDFHQDHLMPFVKRFTAAIHSASTDRTIPFFIFFETVPNEDPGQIRSMAELQELGIGKSFVYAPHWYDLSMAFTKSFSGIVSHNVQELSRVR
jgi:hypothetical protein